MQYVQDNDEYLPNPYYFHYVSEVNGTYTSNSAIEPYIKNRPAYSSGSIWVCPDISLFYTGPVTAPNPGYGAFRCTYSMNVFLNPPDSYDPDPDACYTPASAQNTQQPPSWNPSGGPFADGSYSNENNLYYNEPYHGAVFAGGENIARIVAPANTDMIFEGYVEAPDVEQGETAATDGYTGLSPEQGDYMQDQGFWNTQTQAQYSWGYPLQPATTPRHKTVNNYLFCDGHVKAMSPPKAPYDITQHPQDNIWLMKDGRNGGAIPPPPSGGC
jgi:prepilin-type processing-associated H-X9-DG protein